MVLTGLFALAWHTRQWSDNHFLKVVGTAAIFIAGIELFHTLSYRGLGLFGPDDGNLPTQLWIAFRFLEAGAFLLAVLLIQKPVKPFPLIGLFAAVTGTLVLAIFAGAFPDAYREPGGLTRFKILSEYLIALSFAATMALLYLRRASFEPRVHWLIQASLLCNILATLAFTRYISVYGFANEVGHYALLLSAYLIYRGVLVTGLVTPYQLMFRDLKRHEGHLSRLIEERTSRLHESELLNQTFINNSPAVIILNDAEGRITLANPAFEALVGSTARNMVGCSVHDAVQPQVA